MRGWKGRWKDKEAREQARKNEGKVGREGGRKRKLGGRHGRMEEKWEERFRKYKETGEQARKNGGKTREKVEGKGN